MKAADVQPAGASPVRRTPALRVVCFAHVLDDRAMSDVVLAVCEEWARARDVEATVVVTTLGREPPRGTQVVDLGGAGRRTSAMVPALARELRRLGPDAVIAHGNGASRAAVLAAGLLGRARPRVICVEHNHYSTAHRSHRRLRRMVDAAVLPRADALVGVSPGVAADLAATFPAAAGCATVVPSPLTRWHSIERLAGESAGHPWFEGGPPVVTSVGNLNARKDHATLIRAVARLRGAGSPIRLAIVGREDDGVHAAGLRALVSELGLGASVDFLGEQRNPLRFVARSAAFALSSRNEGLGIALLEAMACGVPVVSTDCPSGPAWALDDGRCGLLVPVGDDAAMADALARVTGEPRLRASLVAAARRRVERFSPARVAQEYVALVRRVLAGEPIRGTEEAS